MPFLVTSRATTSHVFGDAIARGNSKRPWASVTVKMRFPNELRNSTTASGTGSPATVRTVPSHLVPPTNFADSGLGSPPRRWKLSNKTPPHSSHSGSHEGDVTELDSTRLTHSRSVMSPGSMWSAWQVSAPAFSKELSRRSTWILCVRAMASAKSPHDMISRTLIAAGDLSACATLLAAFRMAASRSATLSGIAAEPSPKQSPGKANAAMHRASENRVMDSFPDGRWRALSIARRTEQQLDGIYFRGIQQSCANDAIRAREGSVRSSTELRAACVMEPA